MKQESHNENELTSRKLMTSKIMKHLPLSSVATHIDVVKLHPKKNTTNLQSGLLAQDIVGLEHHRGNPNRDKEACAAKASVSNLQ
jgi:hypothetical protein